MIETELSTNVVNWFIDRPGKLYPSRYAILDGSKSISYGELRKAVYASKRRFKSIGCEPGDRVIIQVSNLLRHVASLFGVMAIGAVAVPVSPLVTSNENDCYVKRVLPRAVITDDPEKVATFSRVSGAGMSVKHNTDKGGQVAVITHTSGSTGMQKAVGHSQLAIRSAAENVTKTFGITPADRMMCLARPYHAFGLGFGVYVPLFAGASTIAGSPQMSIEEIVQLVATYHPTILAGVPSTLAALLTVPLDLSTLRFVISAGEALPTRVFESFRQKFGVEVLDGLGSTEMLTHFISNLPGHAKQGSCGVALLGYDILLHDDEGQAVPDGAVGSLSVKGNTAMLGYWQGDGLKYAIGADDWLSTGDKLYRTSDGYYYYCGRNDDMIKVAGAWVSPFEVQMRLSGHPAVDQAFVTAFETANTRRLAAYVVPTHGVKVTKRELLAYLNDLPPYMMPAEVFVIDNLPLTNSGKVNRRALLGTPLSHL